MTLLYIICGIGGALLLVRLVRMGLLLHRVKRMADRIAREGVDSTGTYDGLGVDPNMQREDGAVPARLVVKWTHPETGREYEFRSPWFWKHFQEGDEKKEAERFRDIPVRVVLSDPETLYEVDLSPFGLDLFRTTTRGWKT